MAEEIDNTPENIERAVGEALLARSISLSFFSGLGPADLVCTQKSFVRAWLPSDVAELPSTGYYHWVLGADVSCQPAVATYFDSMVRQSTQASWFASGEYKLRKATFCIFNAFDRTDIRCEIQFPGQMQCKVIQPDGSKHDVAPHQWGQAFVSSVLRALVEPPELSCVKVLPALSVPALESKFFETAAKSFWEAGRLGIDPGLGTNPKVHNIMNSTLLKYFVQSHRSEQFIKFIEPFCADEPLLFELVGRSLLALGKLDEALAQVQTGIDRAGPACGLLTVKAHAQLKKGDVHGCVDSLVTALELDDCCLDAWILLAKAHVARKDWENLLYVLNDIPIKLDSRKARKAVVSVDGVPKAYTRTDPVQAADPRRMLLKNYIHEADEDSLLGIEKAISETLPAGLLDGVRRQIYDILVEAMNNLTWDGLLEVRGRVFLMKAEIPANSRSSHSSAQARPSSDTEHIEEDEAKTSESAAGVGLDQSVSQGASQVAGAAESESSQSAANQEAQNVHAPEDVTTVDGVTQNSSGDAVTALEGSVQEQSNGDDPVDSESGRMLAPDEPSQDQVDQEEAGEDEGSEEEEYEEDGGGDEPSSHKVDSTEHLDQAHGGQQQGQSSDEGEGDAYEADRSDYGSDDEREECVEGPSRLPASSGIQEPAYHAESAENGNDDIEEEKVLCKPWLDALLHALYTDLRAYYEWLGSEEKFKQMDPDDIEEEDVDEQTMVTADEWLLRGRLARRLQQLEDAERAMRSATQWGNFPHPWIELAEMYSSEAYIKETLLSLNEFMACFEGYKLADTAPPQVQVCIFALIAKSGMQAVRDELRTLSGISEAINQALLDAVRWHVDGFDR